MRNIIPFSVASLAVTLTICAFFLLEIVPTHYDTSGFKKRLVFDHNYDITPDLFTEHKNARFRHDNTISVADEGINRGDLYRQGGVIKGPEGRVPEVMLWGDSHALMWARVFDEICEELGLRVAFNIIPGVAPFFDIPLDRSPNPMPRLSSQERYEYNKSVYDSLSKWKPKLLVMSTVWQAREMDQAIDIVEYAGELGIKILLIEQPPMLYVGDVSVAQYCAYLGYDQSKNVREYLEQGFVRQNQRGRQLVRDLAAQYTHVEIVEIADIFKNEEDRVWVLDGKEVLYRDDDHLNHAGALKGKNRLKEALSKYF